MKASKMPKTTPNTNSPNITGWLIFTDIIRPTTAARSIIIYDGINASSSISNQLGYVLFTVKFSKVLFKTRP